jgi:CRISPR/Cas system-associated protein Csm6
MICSTCNKPKSLDEFYKAQNGKPGWRRECKLCGRLRCKSYYQENGSERRAQQKRKLQENQRHNRKIVLEYLMQHPCADCGEADVLVLQFDHRENKSEEISKMLRHYTSWSRLKAEIDKCDIRCANCHTRKTAHQVGYWKVRALKDVEVHQSHTIA